MSAMSATLGTGRQWAGTAILCAAAMAVGIGWSRLSVVREIEAAEREGQLLSYQWQTYSEYQAEALAAMDAAAWVVRRTPEASLPVTGRTIVQPRIAPFGVDSVAVSARSLNVDIQGMEMLRAQSGIAGTYQAPGGGPELVAFSPGKVGALASATVAPGRIELSWKLDAIACRKLLAPINVFPAYPGVAVTARLDGKPIAFPFDFYNRRGGTAELEQVCSNLKDPTLYVAFEKR